MAPLTGYFIASKASIKAIPPNLRSNGYTRATALGTKAEWYMFLAASNVVADDDSVLMPNDNPVTGRWHKYAVPNFDTILTDYTGAILVDPTNGNILHT
jgi:hypothetical protein